MRRFEKPSSAALVGRLQARMNLRPADSGTFHATAPAATRQWLASRHARAADVTLMRTGVQVIGTSKKLSFSQCAFGVAVGRRLLLVAVAPLTRTAGTWHGELLRYRTQETLTRLVARFNALVVARGSLRLG
jgi:hypothetical protein